MPRRRRHDLHPAQRSLLPPLHVVDLRRRYAPDLQVGTDAERHEERGAAARQVLDRPHVEVVVMIVRDQHRIDRRQVLKPQRRRMEAPRPDVERRGVLGEHGIDEQAHAIDRDVDTGVPDPKRLQAGRCGGVLQRSRIDRQDRNRAGRAADLVAELAGEEVPRIGERVGGRRQRVHEPAVVVVRIRARTRQTLAIETAAELRQRQHPGRHRAGQQHERQRASEQPAPMAPSDRGRLHDAPGVGADIAPVAGVPCGVW